MGNANGKEEGIENGGGGGDEVSGGSNHAPTVRVPSSDLMVSSPPHDPRQSRPPHLFSPQVKEVGDLMTGEPATEAFWIFLNVPAIH